MKVYGAITLSQMVSNSRLLTFLRRFPEIGDPHVLIPPGIKPAEGFSIISKLAVTACLMINYSRANFVLKGILKPKHDIRSAIRSKTYCQWTISFYNSPQILNLKSNNTLPKYGKTKVKPPLRKYEIKVFFTNNLFKNFSIY